MVVVHTDARSFFNLVQKGIMETITRKLKKGDRKQAQNFVSVFWSNYLLFLV